MNCPACGDKNTSVLETRRALVGTDVQRRHSCPCGSRWLSLQRLVKGSTVTTGSGPVAAPQRPHKPPSESQGPRSLDPGSDLDLFSSGSSGPSKPDLLKRGSDEPKPGAMVVAKGPSAFTRALEQFNAAWCARYGVDYRPSSSDRNQLGRLIAKFTPAELAALPGCFAAYLNDLDPFVAQARRHDLTWFCTKGNGFNKYRTQAPILSAKEARSIAAGEQWEGMIHGKG